MLRNVTVKTLYDQRRGLAGWAVSLVLLVAMYCAVWPSVRDQPSMSDFLNQMPASMRSLFAASGADLSTPTGYVQVELLSFMGPLLLIGYAITSGASAVSGEEDRRTLDLLLSNPISRIRVVLEKLGAMVLGTATLGAVLAVALLVEGRPAGLVLPAGRVLAVVVHLSLLGLVFGALALAVGSATGHSGLSRAVPAVAAVVAYVVNGLAGVVSWLEPVQVFSPFHQYIGHDPLRTGLSWPSVLIALATVAALAALAALAFERRDIAT